MFYEMGSVRAVSEDCVGCVLVKCIVFFFFFFKQKTAYEMCGRDWSSDVCSSDLFNMMFSAVYESAIECIGELSPTTNCAALSLSWHHDSRFVRHSIQFVQKQMNQKYTASVCDTLIGIILWNP